MPLENSKSVPPLSATSTQALLYALETESAKDANKGQKITLAGAFSQLHRVRKLREELLEKGLQTAKASNFTDSLKAKIAEISARQVLENVKRFLRSSLRAQNENNESKDKADRRIRFLLDDIADTKTQSTIEHSDNEAVWIGCAAPQSLTQALEAELDDTHDAHTAATHEDNRHFAAVNRAWDAQKNAISRQLSTLGKIKFFQKIFRVINAAFIPLVSLAATTLVPASFIAATVMKTSAEILLKASEYLAIKPISTEGENSKQREFLEASDSQNKLEQTRQEEDLKSKREHRRQNAINTLEEALRVTAKL